MTTAELITRFPEFSAESAPRLELAIADAELMVGECFGKFRTLAVAYMAAHLFTMGKQTESGNTAPLQEVASESVGSVSTSYVSSNDGKSENSSTAYGQMFDNLRKRVCVGMVSIA